MANAPERIFALPDLGEGLQDAEIVAWHVAEGDHVVADQPLVSVETDKAVVEIPAPRSGRIARLLAPLHARLPIGAPLMEFSDGEERDTGTVVGDLAPPAAAVPVASLTGGGARVRAAPAVRALAASLGVDLASVAGSGVGGEITRADVQAASASGRQSGTQPLSGVRRAMALRMAEAGASVVPATVTDLADVDSWPPHTPLTARLVAALVAACEAEPALNAAFDGKAVARRLNDAVHVGLAVDTPEGLIVPVLRDAQKLDIAGLIAALEKVETAVRNRSVGPGELRGATISLSNFGSIGGRFANLVVVPPQVAILGAGRVVQTPVANKDGIVVRRLLPLSLTFDHRAVTGGEAARFLAALMVHLARPA